ncbi:MAG: hypothetical protein U0269_20650 [Polyangiales bacterium]
MSLLSRSSLFASALAFAALISAHDASAQRRARRAQPAPEPPPSPVALSVEQRAGTLHWRFTLTNRGDQPVDVAIDRNMLAVEITAPAPVVDPATPRRRAPRAPKPARCRGALFHGNTDETARAQLAPGQSYSEGFDLRSLCGVRFPRALVPGASLVFTYGARAKRPSFARAVVFIESGVPIEELRTNAMVLSGDASSFPPATPASDGADRGPVELRAPASIIADRAAGLSFGVSLRGRGSAPLRAFYRPSMFSLEVRTPRGGFFRCSDAPLGYVGLPDYLRTISRSTGPATRLSVGLLCDQTQFAQAGVYLVRVVFESNVESTTSREPSFRGRAVSRWIAAVVRRGSPTARYSPLSVEDPYAPAPAQTNSGDHR